MDLEFKRSQLLQDQLVWENRLTLELGSGKNESPERTFKHPVNRGQGEAEIRCAQRGTHGGAIWRGAPISDLICADFESLAFWPRADFRETVGGALLNKELDSKSTLSPRGTVWKEALHQPRWEAARQALCEAQGAFCGSSVSTLLTSWPPPSSLPCCLHSNGSSSCCGFSPAQAPHQLRPAPEDLLSQPPSLNLASMSSCLFL